MKKIFILILLFVFGLFTNNLVFAGGCSYNGDIKSSLNGCLSDTTLVNPGGNLNAADGALNPKIYSFYKTLATILSLAAVLGIVYGSFMLVTAAGEDEKIKKGKDVIKWSIIGFLGVVLASSLIVLITKFIFDLGS